MSFELKAYDAFLQTVCETGNLPVLTVHEAAKRLDSSSANRRCVILRHDVDRRARRAVYMATLEANHNIRSTFYFRSSPSGKFPQRQIEIIRDFGHEIGYHYECLSRSAGDRKKAMALFRRDLASLRAIAPCSTVAMHGAPLSPHDNGTLLANADLAEFDLVADAVLSFNAMHLFYFTDAGGRWNASHKHNRRDRVGLCIDDRSSPDDPDFASWLDRTELPVYVSTHPERWTKGTIGLWEAKLRDMLVNQGKLVVRLLQDRK